MNSLIKNFTTRMPEKLNLELTKKSKTIGISLNALILQILWEYVNKI